MPKSYSDQVRTMTVDPGARFLAGVCDELQAKLLALTARVDACCDDSPATLAPPAPTPAARPPSPSDNNG